MRKVVSSENGTASLADKGYFVGGKTGTAESYGDKKIELILLYRFFQLMSKLHSICNVREPKINKDLIYNYRVKTKLLITLLVGILFM